MIGPVKPWRKAQGPAALRGTLAPHVRIGITSAQERKTPRSESIRRYRQMRTVALHATPNPTPEQSQRDGPAPAYPSALDLPSRVLGTGAITSKFRTIQRQARLAQFRGYGACPQNTGTISFRLRTSIENPIDYDTVVLPGYGWPHVRERGHFHAGYSYTAESNPLW